MGIYSLRMLKSWNVWEFHIQISPCLLFSGVLPATHNCRCGGSRRMEALPLEPKFPGAPET